LIARVDIKKRITANEKGINPALAHRPECRVKIGLVARSHDHQLQSYRACRRLHFFDVGLGVRIPVGQRLDLLGGDVLPVLGAEQVF